MTRISLVLAPEPTHPTAPQPPACSRLAWELPLRLLLSDHLDRWERGQRGGDRGVDTAGRTLGLRVTPGTLTVQSFRSSPTEL